MSNLAIAARHRKIVAKCLRYALESQNGIVEASEEGAIAELANGLDNDGPPLVSTADILDLLGLLEELLRMKPGSSVTHHWGTVKRTGNLYLLGRGQTSTYNPLTVARKMYEKHLKSRGLTDYP